MFTKWNAPREVRPSHALNRSADLRSGTNLTISRAVPGQRPALPLRFMAASRVQGWKLKLRVNLRQVAAEITRRIFWSGPLLRLLTSAATVEGFTARTFVRKILIPVSVWLGLLFGSPTVCAGNNFPEYQSLAGGALRVRLLPGQREVVFTMYGTPGDLAAVRQLVAVMQAPRLGNGFDPGPAPRPHAKPIFDYLATVGWPVMCYPGCADMQVAGGRCVLRREDEAALSAMDQAGVFTAVQLGEWGYYFHVLSHDDAWWHAVYGSDYEQFKHLEMPAGLAGFAQRPTDKRAGYEAVKGYFLSRQRDLLGRVISVTGHSHYEAYAAEWGARCIGLEVGENIAFTQSKLAFARGASRQWSRPWSVQVSPWFQGACTTAGPLRKEGRDARGLDAGHSLSFYERMWLHAWFAGAAMVTPENSLAIFFEQAASPWTLTSHGRKAAEVFQFMRQHERGVPYVPVAILLDHLAGYNGYMDKPWGILEPTPGDREVRDLFDYQLFPGADHIHGQPDRANPEAAYLRPTLFGESFDVLLTGVPPGFLTNYPAILLAGDVEISREVLDRLGEALSKGSTVLISERQRAALGKQFPALAQRGRLEVLNPWTNPATRRSTAISDERLARLSRDLLPIEVRGDAIQYQVNRTPQGWVIELINNQGVAKKPDEPAVIDARATARVTLESKLRFASAREWRSNRLHPQPKDFTVEIGPGATEYVEFVER